ncbi:MAG: hypothetical protein ACOYON_10595 [Fimbriimonas sp.]
MSRRKKRIRALGCGCLVVVIGAIGFLFFTEPGNAVRDLWNRGILQAALVKEDRMKFDGDSRASLKALHTALMLYHDSEGAFPPADRWMDAIENRLASNDLDPASAKQKLVRPDLRGTEGQYGYALNVAAAGKYKADAGKGTTILVFESTNTKKNATGDPKRESLADGLSVTFDGKLNP